MDARLVYQTAVGIAQKAQLDLTVAILTQSTLRLEQLLVVGRTQYTFGVLTSDLGSNNSQPTNTEVRLRVQDSFITSMIAYRLAEPATATDTTYVDCTYPSPTIFNNGVEAVQLESLYKAILKITVNGTVLYPGLHMGRFRKVQYAQKATAAANQNGIAQDSIDGSSDGALITEPNLVLIGSKGNLITTEMPVGVTTIGAAGFTRHLFEFRGALAQNSTIIV